MFSHNSINRIIKIIFQKGGIPLDSIFFFPGKRKTDTNVSKESSTLRSYMEWENAFILVHYRAAGPLPFLRRSQGCEFTGWGWSKSSSSCPRLPKWWHYLTFEQTTLWNQHSSNELQMLCYVCFKKRHSARYDIEPYPWESRAVLGNHSNESLFLTFLMVIKTLFKSCSGLS